MLSYIKKLRYFSYNLYIRKYIKARFVRSIWEGGARAPKAYLMNEPAYSLQLYYVDKDKQTAQHVP